MINYREIEKLAYKVIKSNKRIGAKKLAKLIIEQILPLQHRFIFSMNKEIEFGTPTKFTINGTPERSILVERILTNIPCKTLFLNNDKSFSTYDDLYDLSLWNVDLYDLSSWFKNQITFPRKFLEKGCEVFIDKIDYTGLIPEGYEKGFKFPFTISHIGKIIE